MSSHRVVDEFVQGVFGCDWSFIMVYAYWLVRGAFYLVMIMWDVSHVGFVAQVGVVITWCDLLVNWNPILFDVLDVELYR